MVAILAPLIAPYDPLKPEPSGDGKPPTLEHLLGTDNSGRDVLSRLIYGARVSLSVGFVAVSIYLVIGTILGAIAGYRRGMADAAIMRFTDTVMSFPALIIILAIIPIVGPSIFNIMLVIGLLGWPAVARLVRGEFLSLREREFTLAARVIGACDADHRPPHPAQRGRSARGRGQLRGGGRDHHRGRSQLPGPRRPAAGPVWGNMLNTAIDVGTILREAMALDLPGPHDRHHRAVDQLHR